MLTALRQEAQLLNEEFINGKKIIIINYLFIYFLFMPMYPTNKSPNVTQNIETYTLNLHVIPHQSCANVLVSKQIKHVTSQLPKASNKLENPTSDHVFKILSLLMKSITNF
jgi:hypothetical protein